MGRYLRRQLRRQRHPGRLHRGSVARRVPADAAPACSRSSGCSDFGFPYDDCDDYDDDDAAKRDRVPRPVRAPRPPARSRRCSYVGNSGAATLISADELPAAARRTTRRTAPSWNACTTTDRRQQHGARPARGREDHLRRRATACPTSTPASSSSATAATTRTPTRAARRPTASTTTCTTRSATRSSSSTTTSPTWAGLADKVCVDRLERVQPPHPAERQRHRPRLAGTDVRHRRRGERRRLRQPSRTSPRPRSTTTATPQYSQDAGDRSARPTSATSTAPS